MKEKLKNPSTLNFLEIIVIYYYIEEHSEVNIAIHYTAQNDLGADLDSYFHYIPTDMIGVEVSSSTYESLWKCIASGEDSYYSVKIADGFYSHGEDLETNTFGFFVDLDDYNLYE